MQIQIKPTRQGKLVPRVKAKAIVLLIILSLGGISYGTQFIRAATGKLNPAHHWQALLQRQPYPYTIDLHTRSSKFDGTYIKKALRTAPPVPCRRCPDWLPGSGLWKLQLNNGVYRVIHLETGWKSIGTYIVAKDRILLANDPVCVHTIGLYKLKRVGSQLVFDVIDDPCHIRLRAKNLTETPWRSC